MLPIILRNTRIALAGAGEGLSRRRNFLTAAGVSPELLPPTSSSGGLAPFTAVFVAGLSRSRSAKLAAAARHAGVLVNVEDEPDLCDFFVPAVVRRGYL